MRALSSPYARAQGWLGRDFYWPSVSAEDGREYDVDRIPPGTTVQSDLDASDSVVDALGKFTLPPDLTVKGDVSLLPGIDIPERMTIHGYLSLRHRPKDCPPVVLPESLHVDREIRMWHRDDVAWPVPDHLSHRIRVVLRKLTGFTFVPWDEDGDEEPAPGM